MSYSDRKSFVLETGRCLCCLGVGHRWEACYSKVRCAICAGKHHLLVHEPEAAEAPAVKSTFFGYCTSNVLVSYNTSSTSSRAVNPSLIDVWSNLVATAFAVVAVRNPVTQKTILINALYDTGANNSTVSAHVAALLLLDGDPETYVMEVSGCDLKKFKTKYCFIQIGDQNGSCFLELGVRILPHPCGSLRHLDWNSVRHHFPHFANIPLMTPVNKGRVDMILGTDCSSLLAAEKPDIVGQRVWDPVVKQTKLGNIPVGVFCPNLKRKTKKKVTFTQHGPAKDVSSPHADMKQIFNVEDQQTEFLLRQANPVRRILAKHDQAIEQFYSSLRVHNNQAVTRLIWKDSQERPKNNFVEAYDLFLCCEEFYRAPEIREAIQEILDDWDWRGFIFEIDQQEARTQEASFYIPTFVVSRLDKQTTKHRLVFNAAREFLGGSLNDFLMAGPNNVPDLADVLLKFRRYRFTFMADIVQMFMNVIADERDQPFLRFIHRNARTGNIQVFQCTRLPFGLSCSPFLAVETVKHAARTLRQQFPFASEALTSSTIVDDIITSVETSQELTELDEGIKAILGNLTMSTHKKASNSHDFMSGIPESQRAKEIDIKDLLGTNSLPVVKALGLIYVPASDQFLFRYDPHIPEAWAMRSLVSFAAKLFDPLGFLSPFLMTSKIIIQTGWREGLTWDEPLPQILTKRWVKWLRQAPLLSNVSVPRWVQLQPDTELHIFADASTAAYAAVAYAVSRSEDRISSVLLMSKSRVAPIAKQESVARLELSACQLGVSLAQKLSQALGVPKSSMSFWTDSSTCLYWLHTKELLSTYVANRVCFILDNTDPTQWRHVPTQENPADVPTQGSPIAALVDNELWWNGPKFLSQQPGLWRPQPDCVPTSGALAELVTLERAIGRYSFAAKVVYTSPPVLDLVFAGVARLGSEAPGDLMLRLRALERIQNKIGKTLNPDPLLPLLIIHAQHTELPELLYKVKNGCALPKTFRKLNLFLHQGILRVGGRLAQTPLFCCTEQFPAVLPKNSLVAEHLVMDIHARVLRHMGGPLHLMNQVQRHFWLFGGRTEVTRILKSCHRCSIRAPKQYQPQLAPLHYLRVPDLKRGNIRPFLKIGIDLAGPWLTIKQGTPLPNKDI